jgi:hypothetical protein
MIAALFFAIYCIFPTNSWARADVFPGKMSDDSQIWAKPNKRFLSDSKLI